MKVSLKFEMDGEPTPYVNALNSIVKDEDFVSVVSADSSFLEECLNLYYNTPNNNSLNNELIQLRNSYFFKVLSKTNGLKDVKPKGIVQLYPTVFGTFVIVVLYGMLQTKEVVAFLRIISSEDLLRLRSSSFRAGVYSENEKRSFFISLDFSKVPEILLNQGPDFVASGQQKHRVLSDFLDSYCHPELAKKLITSHIFSLASGNSENLIIGRYLQRVEKECMQLLNDFKRPELQIELKDLATNSGDLFAKELSLLTPQGLFDFFVTSTDLTSAFVKIYDLVCKAPRGSYVLRFLAHAFRIGIYSPAFTKYGLCLPSITSENKIELFPLNLDELSQKTNIFWDNQPFDVPVFSKEIIGSNNCHIDYDNFIRFLKIEKHEIEKSKGFASRLLREAVELKKWTIPWGAYVKVDSHPFVGVKLYEVCKDVYALLIFSNGLYAKVGINPYLQHIYLPQRPKCFGFFEDIVDADTKEVTIQSCDQNIALSNSLLASGIAVFLSSMIRDFWVVEERERVFGKSIVARSVSQLSGDRRKPVIVYLPRVKYKNTQSDIVFAEKELDLVNRCEHFVVGHLRKALKASNSQLSLARDYGINVPEGFTFVKPHKRGHLQAEKLYRSRSAMQCLKLLDFKAECGDNWFSYELNTKNWLEDNGFLVYHQSGSRNGDGGVDLRASKDNTTVLVQCKYWKNPVGIAVLRELYAVLQEYPKSTYALVVTASNLTQDAKEYANAHSIGFLENLRFDTKITAQLPFLER